MENEIWRKVIDSDKEYYVSNFGRIKSVLHGKDLMLKLRHNGNGYLRVDYLVDGAMKKRFVHRVVASAFVENKFNYNEVNHIDGNKTNNNASNLQWCTRSMNNKHAYKLGLRFSTFTGMNGGKSYVAKPIKAYDIISGKTLNYNSRVELCNGLGIGTTTLYNSIKSKLLIKKRYKLIMI